MSSRTRSSNRAGAGIGTTLVLMRLEPSALYWYFAAKLALTLLELTEPPPPNGVQKAPPLLTELLLLCLISVSDLNEIDIFSSITVSTN